MHVTGRFFCGAHWCPGFVFLWSPRTTARKGLVHLVTSCHVALVLCWLGVHLGGKTGSPPPSPSATSSCTVASSEEEGLPPSSLTFSVCTSSLTLHTTEEKDQHFSRKGGTGPLPHNVGKFLRGAVLARFGTLRRYHPFGSEWGSPAQMGRSGDTIRLGRNGAAAQMDTPAIPWSAGWQRLPRCCGVGTARTLGDTMRWCAWPIMVCISGRFGGTFRFRCAPEGWVVHWRGASDARSLAFGQQVV